MYKLFGGFKFPYCLREIKNFPWAIKYRFQRSKRGWADVDTFDLFFYFIEVMKPALERFRKTHYGYPGTLTNEEWDNILDRMIFLLGEMNEETCSQQNEYYEDDDWFTDWDDEKREKSYERILEIDKYMNSCKDEFFELFSKHFYSLWD